MRRICLLLFLGLFCLALASCTLPAFTSEGDSFLEIVYQWELLREADGVNRVVAQASYAPASGPLRDGNLLAFVVRQNTLVVVDLETEKVEFLREFPAKCLLHRFHGGRLFYYLGEERDTRVLSLATGEEQVFPGLFVLVTEGGAFATRERDTLHIFDVESGELLLSEPIPGNVQVLSLGDVVFVPTRDAQRNFSGYVGFAVGTRKRSTLPSLSQGEVFFPERAGHTLRTRHVFPGTVLPILRKYGEEVSLELLDQRGETLWQFPLDFALPSRLSPSPLLVLDSFGGKFLLAVEDATGAFHLFFADTQNSPVPLRVLTPQDRTLLWGGFFEGETVAAVARVSPRETFLFVFSPEGNLLTEKTLELPGIYPSNCEIIGNRELLAAQGHVILRYVLPQGTLAGLYVFPEGYERSGDTPIVVHREKGFAFLHNAFRKKEGLEKPALVAFDVSGEGFPPPLELVAVSPHGESLEEVFEDVPTELRFRTLPELKELLSVHVAEVSIERQEPLTFIWLTPKLQGTPSKVSTVTASLGPVKHVFPMTVVPLPNPLRLAVEKYYEDGLLVVHWTLRNVSPVDLGDLETTLVMQNLQYLRGDAFPKRLGKGETARGKLYFELRPQEAFEPSSGGYTVPASGTIRVHSSRGTTEASFESPLEVRPEYAFEIWIQKDPARPHLYLTAEEIVAHLQVFDAEGNDITLNVTLEKIDNHVVRIGNIAPGFSLRPLRLHLRFRKTWRAFEVEQKPGSPRKLVLAPDLEGSWDIPLVFPDDAAFPFRPPRFTLALPPNALPQPDFVIVDDEVTRFRIASFDGSPSRDPDGVIVWYRWSFPNAADIEAQSFGYAFPHPQIVPLTLEVRDDRESQVSLTREVAVDGERMIGGRRVTIPPAFVRQNATTYEVEVLTGDLEKAGTDARVFLALYERKEREGVVYGSGVMELSRSGDSFERGKKDVFQVTGRRIENLDRIALLHDNSGENPGWYVSGIRIKDVYSGKEWFFLPNRWLALDEADHKTHGEFTPCTNTYPAGIFIAGDRRSLGLIEVSDTVFIVPEGLGRFYFTCLDETRYMEVFRENNERLGYQNASSGKRTPPFIPQEEWGVAFDTSSLTKPERFRIWTQKGGEVKEEYIWVFPSSWANHRDEALRATLLLPFKGKTDAFLCAQETRNRLSQLQPNAWNAALPVIDYGVDAFSIFGASPDDYVVDALSECTGDYLEKKVALLRQFGYAPSVLSGFFDLLLGLYDALAWGMRLPGVSSLSAAESYKVALLNELGSNYPTLCQIDRLLRKGKELVESVITHFEANSPSSCAEALSTLRTLAVGGNPTSSTLKDHEINYGSLGVPDCEPGSPDYPLGLLLSLAMADVRSWREDGHPIYQGDDFFDILPHDPVTDTNAALDVYEPLLRNIIQTGSVLVEVCLLEGK